MSKIPDCDRCSLYAHNPHLVCAVHPSGVETDKCLDFRPDPNIKTEEQWSPEGYFWYGDELISDCDPRRRHRLSRYSPSEQIQILDTHFFFTGVCPQCKHEFSRNNLTVHYDCPDCGWIDDSV